MTEALQFLVHTLFGLFTTAVLLRFFLQLTGAPFQNPVSQAVVSVTNFAVIPLRRMIPGWRGLDLSTLLLAFISEGLMQILLLWISDFPLGVAGSGIWGALLLISLAGLLKHSVYIFAYAIILQALLSWVNPYTPVAPALHALTKPILNPVRRYLPSPQGLDLSPLYVFILAELIIMLFISPIERSIFQQVL